MIVPAGPHERFTPEAAASMVGQTFVAKHDTVPIGVGKVVAARLLPDGSVALDITWPDVPGAEDVGHTWS